MFRVLFSNGMVTRIRFSNVRQALRYADIWNTDHDPIRAIDIVRA